MICINCSEIVAWLFCTSGAEIDNSENIFAPHHDFAVNLISRERGVKVELVNPPAHAFVDGQLIKGVHEHIFSVLRDLLHMGAKYSPQSLARYT